MKRYFIAILLLAMLTTGGAKKVVQRAPLPQPDSTVAHFSIHFEDSKTEVWTAIKAGVFNGIPIGVSVIPDNVITSVDSNFFITIPHLRHIRARGHEIMSGGYTEDGNLFNGDIGQVTTGLINISAFRFEYEQGFYYIRDVLRLGTPRIHNHSGASATTWDNAIIAEYFDYATVGAQTASDDLKRPNELFAPKVIRYGTAMTSSATALPGMTLDPYEIDYNINENSTMTESLNAVKWAVQTRGFIMMIGHTPDLWNTSLGGGADYASLRAFLANIKATYVDTGVLIIDQPSRCMDHYFGPLGPEDNVLPPGGFKDWDGDGNLDFMFSGSGASYVAPVITLIGTTGGYGNGPVYALNWAGAGLGSAFWGGTTSDQAWEVGKCQWLVYNRKGKAIHFEIAVRVNAGVDPTYVGERVGVTFGAPLQRYYNGYGNSPDLEFIGGTNSAVSVSSGGMLQTIEPPSFTFAAGDIVGTKWVIVEATFAPPERADYIFINLWKTAGLDANAVQISAPRACFYSIQNGERSTYVRRP